MVKINYSQIEAYYPYWADVYKEIDDFEKYFLEEIAERITEKVVYTKGDKTVILEPADHYPSLKTYSIFEAGYIQGDTTTEPIFLGSVKARNFAQACHILMCKKYLEAAELKNDTDQPEGSEPFYFRYDPIYLTFRDNKLCSSIESAKKVISRKS